MATAIKFNGNETTHTNEKVAGQFQYTDWDGRSFTLDIEELTVIEPACVGNAVARVGLPEPGSEAAFLLVDAVLAAMAMGESYELVKRSGA